jgi:hypothetical protein
MAHTVVAALILNRDGFRMARFHSTLLFVALSVAALPAADFTGTWKLNPEKSKLGYRDITQATLITRQTGPETYSSTLDYVTRSGQKRHEQSVRVCDGKEHPLPAMDSSKPATVVCEIGPDSARRVVEKKSGKIVVEMNSTVSADGRVLTNVWKYEDGAVTYVFEKQ